MTVEPDGAGHWRVVDAAGEVLAAGLSNAAAWRFVDGRDAAAVDHEEKRERISRAIGQW